MYGQRFILVTPDLTEHSLPLSARLSSLTEVYSPQTPLISRLLCPFTSLNVIQRPGKWLAELIAPNKLDGFAAVISSIANLASPREAVDAKF